MKERYDKYAVWILDIKNQLAMLTLTFVLLKPIAEHTISILFSTTAGMMYSIFVLAFTTFNMLATKHGAQLKEKNKNVF